MGNFTIEARAYEIPATGYLAGHDFLVLKDGSGNIIAELHGLATDQNNVPVAIGIYGTEHLLVWHFVRDNSYSAEIGEGRLGSTSMVVAGQPTQVLFSGSEIEAAARWKSAVDAMPTINGLELQYPPFGFNILSPTVNSNSTCNTLIELMGLTPVNFPGLLEPGIDNRMLPDGVINTLKYKGGNTSSGNSDGLDDLLDYINNGANSQTNRISVDTNTTGQTNVAQPSVPGDYVNGNGTTIGAAGSYTVDSLLGNVNTSTDLTAIANYTVTDSFRPGDVNLNLGLPTDTLLNGYNLDSLDRGLTGSMMNTGSSSLHSWLSVDPLVLDLNGDGVRLTNFSDAPVQFDVDNDGGSLEQTGWISASDGIVVHDRNGNGVIDNISETLSEYYKGDVVSVGVAGTKPYSNGFSALKSLDTNSDNVFNASDAAFNQLRVWVDANHDGKSWVDTNNNGVKDGAETVSELKTFAQLGITQINLSSITQSGEVRDGNEVLARGSFVQDGSSKEAIAANFLSNPAGSVVTQGSSGVTATLDGLSGANGKSYVSKNTVSTVNESLSATTLAVKNITGGAGGDTLTGDGQNNWLMGGLGADVFRAGAGDDVILVDAPDLAAVGAVDGGDGLDMVQIVGAAGVKINMADSHVEIVVGNVGNDLIIGGGGSSVFVRGGDGDDAIFGSAANDALSGENGDDYIEGGAGNDIIRGHTGRDQLLGGAGDDILDGGLSDDTISGGVGDDVIIGGGGDDVLDGGEGSDLVQYAGSFADYRFVQLDDTTWRVIDIQSGRQGADIIRNVENLGFSNLAHVALADFRAMPVQDVVSVSSDGQALTRTSPFYISKSQLLKNDISSQGATLTISSVTKDKGGDVALVTAVSDPHFGDILFTPDATYQGVMSFTYKVEEGQYHFTVTDSGSAQSAQLAATVYLTTPDLPNDPLLVQQRYLSDVNVLSAWKDYSGKGVRIGDFEPKGAYAVTNQGFDIEHPDLISNVDKTWLNTPGASVATQFSDHATMVAGIMAAARNGMGGVGVAYGATIAGEAFNQDNVIASQTLYNEVTSKFRNYDVVNNSWGFPVGVTLDFGKYIQFEAGEYEALQYGRDGLGTAIVWAAGNERAMGSNTNWDVTYSNPGVIVVGAINASQGLAFMDPSLAKFTTPGASVLVSAPASSVLSTSRELINDNGSVFGGDYLAANGTSVAAPIVSGVVALMLEANPGLGYRDIQTILAMTATKFNDPAGTDWTTNAAKNWNGGGMHVSHDYGFGEVDARAAVRLAESWYHQSTLATLQSPTFIGSATQTAIPDGSGLYSSTVQVSAGIQLESVQVGIQLTHQNIGDLIIKLVAPSGTESILLDRYGKAPGSGTQDTGSNQSGVFNFNFNTTHVRGESSDGAWTLKVYDAKTGASGVVNKWQLTTLGSPANEVQAYIYTDEFSESAGSQRATLTDTNGGDDILNASAVSSNSTINLNNGATCIIDGRSLVISGDIEKANGGDGDDVITGNALSNILTGGRGADVISSGAGRDLLDGGAGSNTLTGGTADDFFVVRHHANATDIITDFDVSTGAETIVICGFPKIFDFAGLVVTADGSLDTRIMLGDGQSILLKNVKPNQISEQNFNFVQDNDQLTQFITSASANTKVTGFTSGNDPFILEVPNKDIVAYGLGGDDYLVSRALNDYLDGGNGNDWMAGDYSDGSTSYPAIPDSQDWMLGGAGDDTVDGNGGDDSLFGGSGDDYIEGENGADLLIGGSGRDVLIGGAGHDILCMDGDLGVISHTVFDNDGTRIGGTGADVFKFITSSTPLADAYIYAGDGSLNGANLIVDFEVGQAGEVLDLTNISWIRGYSDLDITSFNQSGYTSTVISASNGTEYFKTLLNGVSPTQLNSSHFKFAPNPGFVGGKSGADSLTGDAGANLIDGMGGADTMVGRTGNDTYVVDNKDDVIEELPGGGFDTVASTLSYTLNENVEALALGGISNINGTGNSERNRITGNGGNNRLDGGGDADDMQGGAGDDTYVVDNQLDTVLELADQGIDTVESSVSWSVGANVEYLTLTGSDAINATGNDLANKLRGNAGDNILDGLRGEDTMTGLAGNDVYYVDSVGDVVEEAADGGIDSIYVPFDYALSGSLGNVENLAILGSQTATLTGNALSNVLRGNKANNKLYGLGNDDLLDGGAGADTMEGGSGNDTYVVDNASDVVTEIDGEGTDLVIVSGLASYTLKNHVEQGMRLTAGTIVGNDLANELTGSGGDDRLQGEAGMDTLSGGVGADTMVGGSEDDTYYVDNTDDVIIEHLEADGIGSYDAIFSSVSYAVPEFVEAVTLTGSANINATASSGGCDLTGNIGNNYLKGGDGLDFIFGDEGVDILEGGAGDDYYYLTGNEDTVLEQAGAGLDQIWAYGDGITMAANVERLYMQSFLARTATGNDGNNLMQGNNRANVLYGKGGNDKLFGLSGDDTIYGGVGSDSLYGSVGNDTYHFLRGDGADLISDLDSTTGNQDKLMFDGAIDSSQVWLAKSGNDLVVSIIGTTDKVTISSWYLGDVYQVENIVAGGNGKTLSAANVQNLVNAMASFTPPAQGQTTLPANYQTSLNGVIAANWV